jgi:hypothetical protein
VKVTNGPPSAKNEVSQAMLNRFQREDTRRRSEADADRRPRKEPENNGDKKDPVQARLMIRPSFLRNNIEASSGVSSRSR